MVLKSSFYPRMECVFLMGLARPDKYVCVYFICIKYVRRDGNHSFFYFLILIMNSPNIAYVGSDPTANQGAIQYGRGAGTAQANGQSISVATTPTTSPFGSGGGGKGEPGSQSVPDTNARLEISNVNSPSEQIGDSLRMEIGGNSVSVKPANYINYVPSIMKSIAGSTEDSIISYLRKPMISSTGIFQTTDGPSTFPVTGLLVELITQCDFRN